MRQVNVLITREIGEEYLRQIRAFSPEIKVTDASDLVASEERGDSVSSKKLVLCFYNLLTMFCS